MEQKLIVLEIDYNSIIDEELIMSMLQELTIELPSLKECLEHACDKKKQRSIARENNDAKHRLRIALRNEIFYPYQKSRPIS